MKEAIKNEFGVIMNCNIYCNDLLFEIRTFQTEKGWVSASAANYNNSGYGQPIMDEPPYFETEDDAKKNALKDVVSRCGTGTSKTASEARAWIKNIENKQLEFEL